MSTLNNDKNPKRFLFNTQFHWPYAPVDYSLAMALRARGHKVAMVACGGLAAYCEQQTSIVQRQSCQSCIARVTKQFERFKLPYYMVRDNYSSDDIAYANKIGSEKTVGELLKLNVKGVPVGKYARLNLFQYYHGYPFEITGDKEEVFRQIIKSGTLLTLAKERIFNHYSPDMVITVNGKFMQWAPFVDLAKQKDISFVTYENVAAFAPPAGVIFKVNGIAHEQRIDDAWEEESKKSLSKQARQQVYEYFELWKAGKVTYYPFYDDVNESSLGDASKTLGLRSGLPVVSLFPNVSWDSSSVGNESAFESMYHWAFKVVEYAKGRPDVEFIVRAHPHEASLPDRLKTTTPICNEIRSRCSPLPSNLKLVDSSHPITSYLIGNISDVIMVYTSTLGLEFALQGKRPWVAANAYYTDKGFTLDLKSAKHMFDLLDNNHFENSLPAEQVELTERFAHIVRTRRFFSFPYLDGKTGKFTPPNLGVFAPGGNQVIDNLCSYILTGQPFLDIGTGKPTAKMNVSSSQIEAQVIIADDNLSNIKQLAQKQRFGNWQVKFNGLTIYCRDLLSFYMAAKDIFLHRIYDFKAKTDSPVVIDGGGHIGLFTLFVKQKYPNAKITTFEPDKKSLEFLRKNLQVNSFNDVKIVEAGLYKNSGEVSFNSNNSDGSSIYSKEKNATINVVRLSEYIDCDIDFLKLNIEGAELDVISEAASKLQRVKEMVIEYHGFPEVGQNLHKLLTILEKAGFRYIIHDFDAETNPATKPPFKLDEDTRFFLLIHAKKLFAISKPQLFEQDMIENEPQNSSSTKALNPAISCNHSLEDIKWLRSSRIDPNGRLFIQNDRIFRAMIKYDRVYYSKLFDTINSNQILSEGIVRTSLTDKVVDGYECVLEHEFITPQTHPAHWSFNMFRDALLKHIEVHIELLSKGYALQDAHLWNVMFKYTSPILIDFGSIVPPNNNYKSLKEEYYHFCLLPLMLMVIGEFDKARRYLTSGSMPHLTHEDIHGYIVKDVKTHAVKGYYEFIELLIDEVGSDEDFFSFLLKFKKIIIDFFQIEQKSTWSVYHGAEEKGQVNKKITELEQFFRENEHCSVLDIGCAAGFYSMLAAKNGAEVVATEVDQPALDYTYLIAKQKQLRITPVLRNIVAYNDNFDNNSFDIVIAGALIHHLAFTQNMSLDEIVESISKYCNKYLIIEYIGVNDTFVKQHINSYQFEYSLNRLKLALSNSFAIERTEESTSNNRTLLFCAMKGSQALKRKPYEFVKTNSIEPVSRKFGFDRGIPLDRYYIEKFLEANARFIRGRVLEIGDNSYTKKHGTGVTQSDVLNAVASANATIVGDLATGENIPESVFDCIIMTQTIQCIYDIKTALKNMIKALKPGGTLLITASGISQISRYDMDRWGDYWRFTDKSLKTLLAEAMPQEAVHVEAYGNVAVAKAFLDGRALHELPKDVLDYNDNDYQVLLTARVCKTALNTTIDSTNGRGTKTTGALKTPLVLLYHRVAYDPIDSQLLAVSPENFEAHLKELAENYTILPLHQLLEEASKGQLQPNTLAITLDDGYVDNLTNAVPLLEKYGLHATIFVVSGTVGSQSEFWWDALERIFLTGHPLPELLSIQDSQGILEWGLTTAQNRLKAYDELCKMLRVLTSANIDEIVNQLLTWAGLTRIGRTTHRVVDAQQLKLLASSASVEIGSHSITHTRLSSLSPQQQQYEIQESKQQLESIIKKPVRLFSYPYGGLEDITKETGRILAQTGYDAGIANVQGSLVSPVDMYAVPRRLVRNWSGPTFAQWLRDDDKASLGAQNLSDRAERIINSSLLPWSKQKQTIQPQNEACLNNCSPVAPPGVLL